MIVNLAANSRCHLEFLVPEQQVGPALRRLYCSDYQIG